MLLIIAVLIFVHSDGSEISLMINGYKQAALAAPLKDSPAWTQNKVELHLRQGINTVVFHARQLSIDHLDIR